MKKLLSIVLSFSLLYASGQDIPTINGEPVEIGFQKYYNKKSPYSAEGISMPLTMDVRCKVNAKGGVSDVEWKPGYQGNRPARVQLTIELKGDQ